MQRRELLAATGVALGAPLSGCSEETDGQDDGEDTGDGENGGDGETATPEGDHHLYLVNLDDQSRRASLEVVHVGTDESVIDGTYEIPAERGGEFRNVAEWTESYEITVSLETVRTETFTWEIESCDGSEAPDGSRNGSVRIEPDADEISFVTDSCDEIVAGTEVPTGPASQFEVDD